MSTSPLLNLLGELREAIYKATLIQSEPIRLCERSDNASEAARGVHLSLHQAREPALLLACHQIRDEALHIFYRDNVFFSGTQNTLEVWLKAIGPDRAQLLKTIRGFRHSVYFNYAWGKLLVRKIERELTFKGCPLREGVLHMPFGHYSYPELVFWTNGLEDVVEATKAGVVEHTRERYMVIANGDETDLNDVEKQSPVLKKLYDFDLKRCIAPGLYTSTAANLMNMPCRKALEFVDLMPDGQVRFSGVSRRLSLSTILEARARDASPLLSLPPEILNEIMNYTLVDHHVIRLCASETLIRCVDKYTGRPWFKTALDSLARFAEPPLLRTSKWLRRVGLPVFYGANIFNMSHFKDTEFFLTSIGRRKSGMIRHVFASDGREHYMRREIVEEYAKSCGVHFKLFLRPGVFRFAVKSSLYPDKLFWLDFESCTALVSNRGGGDLRVRNETASFVVKKKYAGKKKRQATIVPTGIEIVGM